MSEKTSGFAYNGEKSKGRTANCFPQKKKRERSVVFINGERQNVKKGNHII